MAYDHHLSDLDNNEHSSTDYGEEIRDYEIFFLSNLSATSGLCLLLTVSSTDLVESGSTPRHTIK